MKIVLPYSCRRVVKITMLPLLTGPVRWATTMAFLAMLALAAVYLTQLPAMAASGARVIPDFADIDAYIESEMQAQRIPGLALGIVQGDQ